MISINTRNDDQPLNKHDGFLSFSHKATEISLTVLTNAVYRGLTTGEPKGQPQVIGLPVDQLLTSPRNSNLGSFNLF